MEEVLRLENIYKNYGKVEAIQDLSFSCGSSFRVNWWSWNSMGRIIGSFSDCNYSRSYFGSIFPEIFSEGLNLWSGKRIVGGD
ncbi:MAG: hypothetical protein COZ07_07275 [Candidatus Infernicultor aquiphilus]|uniref:Uncharacterized protein n=1 Tax=Candidatus Infernicultor aquiphilus TaxID=1805029 RepID=A0A2M7PMW3_9BACT|nr:MAG: hypothetical protein COZ07_07275 [Candidatus Atribacteria bacterium CG_4_10_14_3_um_filter_34_13]